MNENIISLLVAFGVGSIITAAVQSWLNNRAVLSNRKYEEQKEAYSAFLHAFHDVARKSSKEAIYTASYCRTICELLGSQDVRRYINELYASKPSTVERDEVIENLKFAMRKDLGVSK